jgi:hypothetical protein
MENQKDWKPVALNVVLMTVLIAAAAIFGWRERPVEMGVMVVACSICLAFANINRIQSFKGAGFQAEMRKAVDEAYATTEHLKAIAAPLVLAGIQNLTFGGRWDGLGNDRERALKIEFENATKLLKLDHPGIKAAFKAFYIYKGIDLIAAIYSEVQQRFPQPSAYAAFPAILNRKVDVLPSVDTVRQALSSLSPENIKQLESLIAAYEDYLLNEPVPG